ncbi:helicase/secretion neighborhood CpaE-like protein [Frankia torreyi]|uniref:Helicase/secretion neighborhood CpaE-like protein n=1 Tax=Frankia torreyi TaxID=1856 RepID=A0A0D8BK88_9ACTN|nr:MULTISPECIES: septum site-determining protein Ssd [Frankia]KJE24429.1 helicase/secretion neighborhood CpaE-like protein [Frankia torreyi]
MPPAMPLLTPADGRDARPLIVTGVPDLLDDLLRLAAAAGVTTTVATEPGALRRAWAAAPLVVVGMDRAEACIAAGLPLRPHVVLVGGHVEDGRVWSAGTRIGADHVIFLPEAELWLIDAFGDLDGFGPRESVTIGVVAGRRGSGASTLAVSLALSGLRHGLRTMLIDADPRGSGVAPGFARLLPSAADPPPGAADRRPTDPLPPPDTVPPGKLGGKAPPSWSGPPAGHGDLAVVSWDLGVGPDVPVGPMVTLLSTARSTSDLVVVDLPWQQDPAAALALGSCRTALVVLRADLASVMAAERVCATVGRRCSDVRAVVRQRQSAGLAPTAVSEMLGVPLAGVIADARRPPAATSAGADAPRNADAPGPLGDRLLARLGLLRWPTTPQAPEGPSTEPQTWA